MHVGDWIVVEYDDVSYSGEVSRLYSFWNRIELQSVCHSSSWAILEDTHSKRHCVLWTSSNNFPTQE